MCACVKDVVAMVAYVHLNRCVVASVAVVTIVLDVLFFPVIVVFEGLYSQRDGDDCWSTHRPRSVESPLH